MSNRRKQIINKRKIDEDRNPISVELIDQSVADERAPDLNRNTDDPDPPVISSERYEGVARDSLRIVVRPIRSNSEPTTSTRSSTPVQQEQESLPNLEPGPAPATERTSDGPSDASSVNPKASRYANIACARPIVAPDVTVSKDPQWLVISHMANVGGTVKRVPTHISRYELRRIGLPNTQECAIAVRDTLRPALHAVTEQKMVIWYSPVLRASCPYWYEYQKVPDLYREPGLRSDRIVASDTILGPIHGRIMYSSPSIRTKTELPYRLRIMHFICRPYDRCQCYNNIANACGPIH